MTPPELVQIWTELASRGGVTLDDARREKLWQFIDLLLDANKRLNLTRIMSRDDAALLHVADALTLLPHLPRSPHRLADVGSGGGVPGIPLAIARPDVQVVLIESTRKKATFLVDAIRALELSNAAVDARRAEQVARTSLRESFDVVVVRAVATLDWLAEWCLPLAKVGGMVLAMKGPKVHAEFAGAEQVIRLLGGGRPELHPAGLPGVGGHVIVRIAKVAPCDGLPA